MNDIIDRPLKELFAAVFHDHQKNNSDHIRSDQEKVLNELLDPPGDFKNTALLKKDGLEVQTQKEDIVYTHSDNLDSRVIIRKLKN